MTSQPKPIVAAFDLDRTLTYCDTLIPFLLYTFGPLRFSINMVALIPSFFYYLVGKSNRRRLKEAILTRFLKGTSYAKMCEQGKIFADRPFDSLLKRNACEKLRWHQNQGHRCVLVSASIELHSHPWGKRWGFNDCLTSELEVTPDGLITGQLKGENCRGAEKVRRLQELLGPKSDYVLYAYGDSEGDAELLKMADFPFYRSF